MHILVDRLASCICFQAARLDEIRLQMFMTWLKSHSSTVQNTLFNHADQVNEQVCGLKKSLMLWFGMLPLSGLIWEYRLILTEIRWWRELDEARLIKIALDCLEYYS